MWNEKEFFEDFAKKNDTVKPTDEFVNKMKNQITMCMCT